MGFFDNVKAVMAKKPYRVNVYSPRANGNIEPYQCRGRFLDPKLALFEVYYSWNDRVSIPAIPQEYIYAGYSVNVWRPDVNTHVPIKNLSVEDAILKVEPALSDAVKVTTMHGMREEIEKTTKPNIWEQYLPMVGFLIAAFIIGGAIFWSMGEFTRSVGSYTEQVRIIGEELKNATIVVTKSAPTPPVNAPLG